MNIQYSDGKLTINQRVATAFYNGLGNQVNIYPYSSFSIKNNKILIDGELIEYISFGSKPELIRDILETNTNIYTIGIGIGRNNIIQISTDNKTVNISKIKGNGNIYIQNSRTIVEQEGFLEKLFKSIFG